MAPGLVETPWLKNGLGERYAMYRADYAERAALEDVCSPEDIAEFGQKTDLGRPAQPEELSPACVFLAAPCCSSYITGMVLPITGSAGDGD